MKCVQGLPLTAKLLTHEELLSVSGQLECEPPNRHLYQFAGNLRLAARQSVYCLALTFLSKNVLVRDVKRRKHVEFMAEGAEC